MVSITNEDENILDNNAAIPKCDDTLSSVHTDIITLENSVKLAVSESLLKTLHKIT